MLAIGFLLAAGCGSKPKMPAPGSEEETALLALEEPVTEYYDGEVDVIIPEKRGDRIIWKYDEYFNDSNYVHYPAAERLGIDPMHSLADAYHTRRPLLKVRSGENYEIDRLTHSMPYLVPEAAGLLEEIGRDFNTLVARRFGNRDTRLVVTSLLRSPYSVKKLRRVNRNAVDSSTHMFGTTFDIAYNNFHYTDSANAVNAGRLKEVLAEVLLRKRNEGKCYIKYEKKSPCFHITARPTRNSRRQSAR